MQATEILKLIWPLLLLQVAFQIYALVHLFKAKKTKTLTPAIWAVIIVVGEIVGPIVYFILGKSDEV